MKISNITHRKVHKEFAVTVRSCPMPTSLTRSRIRLMLHNRLQSIAFPPPSQSPQDGKTYRVPQGTTLTVTSYIPQHDERVFPDPDVFRPERWLEGKKYANEWIPFGGGPNTCSGKWLALAEIPLLLGLFFREFDAELLDPVPAEEWNNVVAIVGPKRPFTCRIKYTRVGQSS